VVDNIGDNMEEIVPTLYCEKSEYIETLLKYQVIDFDACISGHNSVAGKDMNDRILEEIGYKTE
jgi:hypothetical protein